MDIITYNSHPWIMFSFNWLVIIWRGRILLKLDVQGHGGGRISDVDGQGEWGVLRTEQFSWTSYVYHHYYRWYSIKHFISDKSVFGDNRNKRIRVKEELIKPWHEIVEKINIFFPSIIKNPDNLSYKNLYPIFAISKDKILKQFQQPIILATAIKCKNKMFRFKEIMI